MVSDQGPQDSLGSRNLRGWIFTPLVSHSFEHHAGGSTIWLGSIPTLRENTLGLVRDPPPLFSFHQPQERTCGSTASY
ncbi:hypothetical protein TNCV_3493401 [Trichonephila clavipes]|nr:hypothetical protein TNCV_3493401 [Trichonephila clavipes]